MWSFLKGGLSTILSTVASGIVGPIFGYLGKKQDTTLDGFKTAAGYDLEAYRTQTDHELEMTKLKIEANQWWGPRVLYMIFGVPAALHTAAIFIDSTFTFGTGHYGNLGVPAPPGIYAQFEIGIFTSLFVISFAGDIPKAVAAWLRK